jgi:hypothetical protein
MEADFIRTVAYSHHLHPLGHVVYPNGDLVIPSKIYLRHVLFQYSHRRSIVFYRNSLFMFICIGMRSLLFALIVL